MNIASKIKENVGKVVLGKGEIIDLLMTALISGGHVLLEDVPGVGKTTMAKP
jgi:MoxR-like ATPase